MHRDRVGKKERQKKKKKEIENSYRNIQTDRYIDRPKERE